MTITEPGLYQGIKATDYRRDPCVTPSLSSGIARLIISKSLAHAKAEHPRLGSAAQKATTDAMDRGTLVHAILAGTTADEVSLGEFATFRGKAAQEWADDVRAHGKIPALQQDWRDAQKIAAAVRSKAGFGLTEDPFTRGSAEVSGFWERNGCWFRARYDRLISPDTEPSVAWDWKVTTDVSPAAVRRSFRRFGYHHQAAHYLAGLDALMPQFRGLHSFVFVFVEDEFPYSVRRYTLGQDTLGCAVIDMDRAHQAWASALDLDNWPDGSTAKTTVIEVPTYDDDEPDEISVTP